MSRAPATDGGGGLRRPDAAIRAGARNMRRLSQHGLGGFGCGEGLAIQRTRHGRRVLWIAHESPPKNVTAVDVTDPRAPVLVTQTDLPHARMRSNSLDLVGDLLVIAYQTAAPGMTPAGFEILDVADPARPRRVAFFDASGPASRGVHHLWWVDGRYVHMSAGAADFVARDPRDDQCYRIVDVSDPTRPHEVGRWWLPGTREGDDAPPPPRHPRFDTGFRAHNLHENRPGSWISETVVVGTFFGGGVRAYDIADPFRPREVAWAVPAPPRGSRADTTQLNDVLVDDRGVVFAVDRAGAGLYAYELRL